MNWAGFYFTDPENQALLLLGPFQGMLDDVVKRTKLRDFLRQSSMSKPLHLDVEYAGLAAKEARTMVVADVDEFPGHIACDGASRSEIVVPIVKNGKGMFFILAFERLMC